MAVAEQPNGLVNLPYFATAAGLKSCNVSFQEARTRRARYVLSDSYVAEEHPRVPSAEVSKYWHQSTSDPRFRVVLDVTYVPTFLGP